MPRAIPSRNGRPHELLSSGTEACIFEVIPGTLAKTTSPEEVRGGPVLKVLSLNCDFCRLCPIPA